MLGEGPLPRCGSSELVEAVRYYNREREGLGFEFAAEVRRAVIRIVEFPEAWTPLSKRTRRCRTNRFPYALIYQIRSDFILVVAVMHSRRRPGYWKNRVR